MTDEGLCATTSDLHASALAQGAEVVVASSDSCAALLQTESEVHQAHCPWWLEQDVVRTLLLRKAPPKGPRATTPARELTAASVREALGHTHEQASSWLNLLACAAGASAVNSGLCSFGEARGGFSTTVARCGGGGGGGGGKAQQKTSGADSVLARVPAADCANIVVAQVLAKMLDEIDRLQDFVCSGACGSENDAMRLVVRESAAAAAAAATAAATAATAAVAARSTHGQIRSVDELAPSSRLAAAEEGSTRNRRVYARIAAELLELRGAKASSARKLSGCPLLALGEMPLNSTDALLLAHEGGIGRALTVQQPFATPLTTQSKIFENRTRPLLAAFNPHVAANSVRAAVSAAAEAARRAAHAAHAGAFAASVACAHVVPLLPAAVPVDLKGVLASAAADIARIRAPHLLPLFRTAQAAYASAAVARATAHRQSDISLTASDLAAKMVQEEDRLLHESTAEWGEMARAASVMGTSAAVAAAAAAAAVQPSAPPSGSDAARQETSSSDAYVGHDGGCWVALHAGARQNLWAHMEASGLSAIAPVGVSSQACSSLPTEQLVGVLKFTASMPRAAVAMHPSCQPHSQYAWKVGFAKELSPILQRQGCKSVPCKGQLGLWKLPPLLVAALSRTAIGVKVGTGDWSRANAQLAAVQVAASARRKASIATSASVRANAYATECERATAALLRKLGAEISALPGIVAHDILLPPTPALLPQPMAPPASFPVPILQTEESLDRTPAIIPAGVRDVVSRLLSRVSFRSGIRNRALCKVQGFVCEQHPPNLPHQPCMTSENGSHTDAPTEVAKALNDMLYLIEQDALLGPCDAHRPHTIYPIVDSRKTPTKRRVDSASAAASALVQDLPIKYPRASKNLARQSLYHSSGCPSLLCTEICTSTSATATESSCGSRPKHPVCSICRKPGVHHDDPCDESAVGVEGRLLDHPILVVEKNLSRKRFKDAAGNASSDVPAQQN